MFRLLIYEKEKKKTCLKGSNVCNSFYWALYKCYLLFSGAINWNLTYKVNNWAHSVWGIDCGYNNLRKFLGRSGSKYKHQRKDIAKREAERNTLSTVTNSKGTDLEVIGIWVASTRSPVPWMLERGGSQYSGIPVECGDFKSLGVKSDAPWLHSRVCYLQITSLQY